MKIKEPINRVSQEYNDNVNNPNTELCFYCHTYKPKSEFTNPESGFVCDIDYTEMQRLMKETGITFKEIAGREAKDIWGNRYFLTDTYTIKDGREYHIGGYRPDNNTFDLNHDKSNIFGRKMQFLKSNGGFISFYDHSRQGDPLKFIKWIKEEEKDNFGEAYDVAIRKNGNSWDFHGNLQRISCAFHFRICSEELLKEVIKEISNPYYKNILYKEATP